MKYVGGNKRGVFFFGFLVFLFVRVQILSGHIESYLVVKSRSRACETNKHQISAATWRLPRRAVLEKNGCHEWNGYGLGRCSGAMEGFSKEGNILCQKCISHSGHIPSRRIILLTFHRGHDNAQQGRVCGVCKAGKASVTSIKKWQRWGAY